MKAVVEIGSRQYLVAKGDEIVVSRIEGEPKKLSLTPLLVFDDKQIAVGKPVLNEAKVTVEAQENLLSDKTIAIRYKAKKRVKKIRGARQKQTKFVITGVNLSKSK
jgi:large subunit ribosomal protein L21